MRTPTVAGYLRPRASRFGIVCTRDIAFCLLWQSTTHYAPLHSRVLAGRRGVRANAFSFGQCYMAGVPPDFAVQAGILPFLDQTIGAWQTVFPIVFEALIWLRVLFQTGKRPA